MNIYKSFPAEVLEVRKHTRAEWSFLLNTQVKGTPGQFVMVSLPHVGEVPLSISGIKTASLEVTIRDTGKVTSQLCKVSPGESINIRGPYGKGFPLEEFVNQHLLVIAGGSAVAPAKPLVEYYLNGNGHQIKKLDVIIGFRSPRHILFKNELQKWKKKCHVVITVDNDEDYAWMGSIGFVVDFIKDVKDIGKETKVVIIGPPMMMHNTVRELVNHNVKEENIWLSLERHMKCGLGKCGHCRINEKYVCTDGPVFNYKEAKFLID